MGYSSIEKLFYYIGHTVKEDITVLINSKKLMYPKRKGVIIQPSFFSSDSCIGCGICCADYDTAYSGNEITMLESAKHEVFKDLDLPVENIAKVLTLLEPVSVEVNGNIKTMYHVKEQGSCNHGIYVTGKPNRLQCRWIIERDDGRRHCGIHPIRSVTCGFPHMELFRVGVDKGYSYLGIKQYGRNHQLGCPVQFEQNVFNLEVFEEKLYWLTRLQAICHYLDIPTWLDEIINYLQSNKKMFEAGRIPSDTGVVIECKNGHNIFTKSVDKSINLCYHNNVK